MIIFKNETVMELDSILIMGLNAKENKNPIGQFGTGLKYAIAVLLRENIDFCIYMGACKFNFHSEPHVVRGKEFHRCVAVGPEGPEGTIYLPFTTELGKNWDLWQAYREIYTNCLDEDGEVFELPEEYFEDGCTTICIDADVDQREIFIDKKEEPIYKDVDIEIYDGESRFIYYKGIRALELDEPSKFRYNIMKDMALTEDRILTCTWRVTELIAEKAITAKDKDLIKSLITGCLPYFEYSLSPCSWDEPEPSEEFMSVALNEKDVTPDLTRFANRKLQKLTKSEQKDVFLQRLKDLCSDYSVEITESNHEIALDGGILDH